MWWNDGWGGWWLVMPVLGIAFWVAVIWVVVNLLRGRSGPGPAGGTHLASPEAILADRYARGEIDDDEYRHRLDMLRGTHRPGEQP